MRKGKMLSRALSLLLTLCVLCVPVLRAAFGFTVIGPEQAWISLGLALSILPIIELVKLIQRKTGI